MRRANAMSPLTQRMFAVIATTLATLSFSAQARAQGHWVKLAPLPEKSEEFSFGSANGKIYLFGGLSEGTKPPKGLVQEYDPATDKWTKKKNMPLPTHHAAVASYGGKIYLFGGAAQLESAVSPAFPFEPCCKAVGLLAHEVAVK